MTERVVLQLNDGWVVMSDGLQWIIAKARKRGIERDWKPVSYIGSNKSTLARVLREMGVIPDPGAKNEIACWPERFLEWVESRNAERRAG